MRDLLPEYETMARSGPVGRAVVLQVWGSAPRPEGACLLATSDGRMAGSVSGGCVETAAAEEIREAMQRGTSRRTSWGVTHERAWEMGLSCGGTIEVLIEPAIRPEVLDAARREGATVVATLLGGAEPGRSGVAVTDEGATAWFGEPDPKLREPMLELARAGLAGLTSRVEKLPVSDLEVFLEVFPRRPTLLVFGGVHIAMALVRMARPLGFRTIVADGREGFLTRERFPDADELLLGWPAEVFAQAGLDPATCVCVLTHDPKFDEPALELALRSPACYVGAIGSRKTQAHRRERLRARGFTEAEVARLHGPIGLPLGGRQPAEIALAILAEITAARYGNAEAGGRSSEG